MRPPITRPNGPTMNTTRHPTRTGSALIIVIGTLALISVFAAIYIAVGQNDRRSAATVRQNTDLSEITGAYAEHVARVVAENRLDVIMQPVDSARQFHAPRRVTTDAPYTDWSQRSESDDAWRLFNPAGGNAFPRPRNQQGDDPRVPSNPWLAALRPTYLGDPFERPFSENDPFKHYLDNRDWYQITNVAPDGRFVNLFNLRPTFSDGTVQGSFRAEPGWGVGVNTAGTRVRRMSQGLSLYKKFRPNDPDSPIQSFLPTTEGVWLPGSTDPVIPLTLNQQDIPNTPAVWTMFQRFAFLPADQAFVTYNRDGGISSWADPDYPPYQWADADGDGMFDSRWFELTSARALFSTGGAARDDVQSLYDNSEFRVFGAARIVDLSGMVNVNTAIEGLTPPTRDFPLGLTPSEIDLRRLLTMQDQASEYRGDPQNTFPLSYIYMHQPRFIQGTGTQTAFRTESDYSAHRHFLDNPGDQLSVLDPDSSAMLIGRYAAAAARRGMVQHNTLGAQHRGVLSQFNDPESPFLLTEGSPLVDPAAATLDDPQDLAGGRAATYFRVGRVDPTRLALAGMAPYDDDAEDGLLDTDFYQIGSTTAGTLPFALYGSDDLAELLTYHGINDPENTSRLERNLLGRYEGGNGEERISPLLSTRTLELDRIRHGQTRASNNPNQPRRVTGQIADDSMALFELSPRTVLTPLNGASPLRPMSVAGGTVRAGGAQANTERASVSPLSVDEAATTLDEIVNSGGSAAAFDVFYNALAGELEMYRVKRGTGPNGLQFGPNPNIINQIWEPDLVNRRNNPYATLFYAHRGPELGMRAAAHTAVNLKDLYDSGRQSTVATLILDNEFGDSTQYNNLLNALRPGVSDNFSLTSTVGQLGVFYPGVFGLNRFDLDAPRQGESVNPRPELERVLPEGQLPPRRQAVNVIGVEPMPVISEVTSFYVYTDASTNAGGDSDFTPYEPIPGNPIPLLTEQITINGTIPATGSTSPNSNPDLLAAVFAVQLHNPFDQPVGLGGGTGPNGVMWRKRDEDGAGNANNFNPQNNFEFDYYIEYNGWFFKLGEFWEFTPREDIPGGFSTAQQNTISDRGGTPPIQNARLDDTFPEFQYRDVVLAPGETRVFYAMFHPRFDWVDRNSEPNGLERLWADVIEGYDALPDQFINAGDFDADGDGLPDGLDSRGWTGIAQEWIERQLAVRLTTASTNINRAVRIHPFDPTSGALVRQEEFVNFMAAPGGDTLPGRDPDDKQVRLWRKHTIANYEEATDQTLLDFPNGERRNLVQNDILVDRLYLGLDGEGFNYLEVPLAQSNQSVTGTASLPESVRIPEDGCGLASLVRRNDNRGVSVSRWASVRRRDLGSSLSTEEETAVGRVLPWMVQSRRDPDRTWVRRTNREGRPGASARAFGNSLTYDLFFELCSAGNPPDRVSTTVRAHPVGNDRRYDVAYGPIDLLNAGFTRRNMRVATIGLAPGLKRETDLLGDSGDRFDGISLGANLVGDTIFGSNSPLKPEVFLGKTVDSARIAEALLALGIGPAWAPVVRDLADPNFEDEEWMTLPEAIALATGYETIADPNGADDIEAADVVWHDSVRNVTNDPFGATTEYVLDNLRLRLDDYVPFINVTLAGETGPDQKPVFSTDPNGAVNVLDFRRGAGVPFAFGVLDQLRPFGVLPLPGDELLTDEQREQLRLTRPVMGLVNVQTAPLRVLRLLPGLAPSPEVYSPTVGAARVPEWWAAQGGLVTDDIGVARMQPGDFRDNPDVAAGIAAYRDRLFANPRIRSREDKLTYPFNETSPLTYQPDVADPRNAGFYTQNLPLELLDTSLRRDRGGVAGIPGLRGSPMFASLGELLAVSVRENPGVPDPLADNRRHLTTQAYYGNQTNLGVSGSGAATVTIDPQFTGDDPGITPDDYAERLATAVGLMNTTSVRSDYFAAWLVVQGFRESDVTGLQPDEPLVPSFKRRFLIVIDRSNVINPGDAPRVVLFRELPL